jgi:hypothetical protein
MLYFLAQIGMAAIGLIVVFYLIVIFGAIFIAVLSTLFEGIVEMLSWLRQKWFWKRVAVTIGIFAIALLSTHFMR